MAHPESPAPKPLADPGPWNEVAVGYEEVSRPFLEKFSSVGLARLEERGSLDSTCRLLDVACGPGTTSLLCAERIESVDAVDFSKEMLGVFSARLETKNLDNVTLHHCDAQALPFEDARFDCAVSMFGLMFFPDRVRAMRELHRVLVPGGRVLISSWAPVTRSSAMMALFGAVRAIDPSRPEPETDIDSLENPDRFLQELTEAGFVDIEIDEAEASMDIVSPDAFWDEMAKGAVPIVMMKKQLGQEKFAASSETAKAHLRTSLEGQRTLSSVAYLAIAKKPAE